MFKRVFSSKRPKSVTKSIRVPELMAEILEQQAKETGETFNSYVVLVLDEYLQAQIKSGKIKIPKNKLPT